MTTASKLKCGSQHSEWFRRKSTPITLVLRTNYGEVLRRGQFEEEETILHLPNKFDVQKDFRKFAVVMESVFPSFHASRSSAIADVEFPEDYAYNELLDKLDILSYEVFKL